MCGPSQTDRLVGYSCVCTMMHPPCVSSGHTKLSTDEISIPSSWTCMYAEWNLRLIISYNFAVVLASGLFLLESLFRSYIVAKQNSHCHLLKHTSLVEVTNLKRKKQFFLCLKLNWLSVYNPPSDISLLLCIYSLASLSLIIQSSPVAGTWCQLNT